MGIVGDRPESGVRITAERPIEGGPPWRYRGTAVTPTEDFAFEATIDAEGEVVVTGAAPVLAEKVRLILRTAARNAGAPARKIVRWRADV
jgi:hypothetical protein